MSAPGRSRSAASADQTASAVAVYVGVGVCIALLFALQSFSSAVEGRDDARWTIALQAMLAAALVIISVRLSGSYPRSNIVRVLGVAIAVVSCLPILGFTALAYATQALSLTAVVVVCGVLVFNPSSAKKSSSSFRWELDGEIDPNLTDSGVTGSLKALHAASIIRDGDIRDHGQAVAKLAARLGATLGMPPREAKSLYWAALLHDVGKVGIERNVLRKPGRLTPEQYLDVMRHSNIGADLIRSIGSDVLYRTIAQMVLHHHERWDGRGYPSGRSATHIPIGARIIAITDAYEALLSDRAYRPAVSRDEALRVIVDGAGSQFDPDIVSVFLAMVKDTTTVDRAGNGTDVDGKTSPQPDRIESNGALASLHNVRTVFAGAK